MRLPFWCAVQDALWCNNTVVVQFGGVGALAVAAVRVNGNAIGYCSVGSHAISVGFGFVASARGQAKRGSQQ